MANSISSTDVKRIIFACEAGMGSSVMSVSSLKKKLKKAGVEGVEVVHMAARSIPEDAQMVIVHKGMSKLAVAKAPNGVVLAFNQFLNDPIFDKVVAAFAAKEVITSNVG
jgi:mannitol-specific phosphotransferase system IIBC component